MPRLGIRVVSIDAHLSIKDENGQPAHISDDMLIVDRGIAGSRIAYPTEDVVAANVDAALAIVLDDLKQYLKRVTGEEAA